MVAVLEGSYFEVLFVLLHFANLILQLPISCTNSSLFLLNLVYARLTLYYISSYRSPVHTFYT